MTYSYNRTADSLHARRIATQSVKIDKKAKKEANTALRQGGFDGSKHFKKVGAGLTEAFRILAKFGIEPDEILSASKFPQKKGSANVDLALTNKSTPSSPTPISDSVLHLQWEDLSTEDAHQGSVEVIAYLT